MDLHSIYEKLSLATSEVELIDFLRQNRSEIENYFVSLTDEEIENNKFDLQNICLEFINSNLFQNNKAVAEFIVLVTHFGELFEKIGFYGAISAIKSNLPEDSSIRYRLNAVASFLRIGHIREYLDRFDTILTSLLNAQNYSDVDFTGQVIQDTINYYLIGKKALESSNFNTELIEFKSLFLSSDSRKKYRFLNHPLLKEYLDGYITEKIYVEPIANKVYVPSKTTYKIFQDLIIDQVVSAGYLKRYKNDEIRSDILNYGRADFTKPYNELTPYDRVQLYCYFNMRKHFFTSYAIYEKIFTSLLKNIFDKNKTLLFIDFGCGALTSGLAIASLYNDRLNKLINFKYLGIDIAGSMIEKANEFSKTELFDNESMFYFYENWDLITDSSLNDIISSDTSIIFNASYLFASSSLDEYNLAEFVNNVRSKLVNQAYFVFQNPDRADRNQKYNNFKTQVYHHVLTSDTQRIYYKNNSNLSFEPSNEIVNYEILTL
jgi:hypothetical protein